MASKFPLPSKEDNLSYNLEDLAGFDLTPVNPSDPSLNLTSLTRDNAQLLVNKLFTTLPLEQVVDKVKAGTTGGSGSGGATTVGVIRGSLACAKIPELRKPHVRLPRQKPVPKPKEPTRWEKFAAEKGIHKKKKSKLVRDEVTGEWGRAYGYGSIKQKAEKRNNWAVEEKGVVGGIGASAARHEDGDVFAKKKAEKQLETAKQKMRELRNKVEGAGFKMLPVQLESKSRYPMIHVCCPCLRNHSPPNTNTLSPPQNNKVPAARTLVAASRGSTRPSSARRPRPLPQGSLIAWRETRTRSSSVVRSTRLTPPSKSRTSAPPTRKPSIGWNGLTLRSR